MIIKGASADVLIKAIAITSTKYDDNIQFAYSPVPLNVKGNRFRFRLRAISARRRKDKSYPSGCIVKDDMITQRGVGRRGVAAACWHVYRDFMIEVFNIEPNAKIMTTIACYNGKEDFYEKYKTTSYRNVGSVICPYYYGESCECEQ